MSRPGWLAGTGSRAVGHGCSPAGPPPPPPPLPPTPPPPALLCPTLQTPSCPVNTIKGPALPPESVSLTGKPGQGWGGTTLLPPGSPPAPLTGLPPPSSPRKRLGDSPSSGPSPTQPRPLTSVLPWRAACKGSGEQRGIRPAGCPPYLPCLMLAPALAISRECPGSPE